MSKNSSESKNGSDDMTPEVKNSASSPQASKQFLLTLSSPRVVLVADATIQQNDSQSVTLSMAHMNFLLEANIVQDEEHSVHSVFCDGLEIFTNRSPCSSLLCPLSVSGSLTKVMRCKNGPQKSGWVWVDEVEARAAYTDLIHAIDVFNGVKEQMTPKNQRTTSKSVMLAKSMNENSSKAKEQGRAASQSTM